MPTASGKLKMIFVVAAFAAFMATFNETFLNVAFTPIMTDLNVGVSTVQWLTTAYMMGAAVMIPVSAFLYKSFPTKRLFLISVSLLIIGSVIGALAMNFPVLLIGRIVQALGTGMLIPISMNIVLEIAPKQKLGIYMGIMGAMITLGPSLSIIIAGTLLSSFSWHVLFWVFAALSSLCFICAACLLRNIAKLTYPRLDALSIVLIGITLAGILYGVSTVFSGSIPIALVAAAVGAACLYAFVMRQKKLAEPLIDLKPLRIKPFAIGIVFNMIALIIIFAMNIIIPVFIQSAHGASSLSASLTLFPAILLTCMFSPVTGRIYDKRGIKNILPLGFAFMCLFTIVMSFCSGTNSLFLLAILYIPVICGSAFIIGPVQSYALSQLDPHLIPHGVTVMSTGFQIAGCIGSSLFTGVYAATASMSAAAGSSANAADSNGFMVAGLLAAAFALAGFILAMRTRKQENQRNAEIELNPTIINAE